MASLFNMFSMKFKGHFHFTLTNIHKTSQMIPHHSINGKNKQQRLNENKQILNSP